MQIHESAEDYLEKILMLTEEKGTVRSIDIVNKMNFSKPSVSVAMKHLREEGKITMEGDRGADLCEAQAVYQVSHRGRGRPGGRG